MTGNACHAQAGGGDWLTPVADGLQTVLVFIQSGLEQVSGRVWQCRGCQCCFACFRLLYLLLLCAVSPPNLHGFRSSSQLHVPYSYGWSIIALTALVKLATYPLTKTQVGTLRECLCLPRCTVDTGQLPLYIVHELNKRCTRRTGRLSQVWRSSN